MNIITNNSIRNNYLSLGNYPQGKYAHTYDALNRRISETKDGVTTQFIWDGNNLHSEQSGTNWKAYTWGIDLSGSLEGAGGVGGLLWEITNENKVSFPLYDGNGNITTYVNANGVYQAQYTYDAFLNGCQGDQFRFQASTKSWNPDLGLLEYQFRSYSPTLGRWIQEDPIQEQGGINLYCFVRNNPVEFEDNLGFGIVYDTYYFAKDPIKFMLSKFKKNTLTFAVIEAAEFGAEFGKQLFKEINNNNILKDIEVRDPYY